MLKTSLKAQVVNFPFLLQKKKWANVPRKVHTIPVWQQRIVNLGKISSQM